MLYTKKHFYLYNMLYMTANVLKTHFNAGPPLLKKTFKHICIYACDDVGDTLLETIFVLYLHLIHHGH